MGKRVKKQIIVVVSLIALVAFAYVYDKSYQRDISLLFYEFFLRDSQPKPDPNFLSGYPDDKWGFYQFDPRTILASLDQGRTDVFTPLLDDPNDESIEYDGIAWSQSDFVRVASALSQKVWNEPLDLNSWAVYTFLFTGDCNDNFGGFNYFDITYYKIIKTGWETVYTARHVVLTPWRGTAEWGGDSEFSDLFIFGWKNIELTKLKTTAEQAVNIAEENGGRAARVKNENKCRVFVDIKEDDWLVDYSGAQFSISIDPLTGQVHSAK